MRAARRPGDDGAMSLEAVLGLGFLMLVAAAAVALFGAMAATTVADSTVQKAVRSIDPRGLAIAVDKDGYVLEALSEGAPSAVAEGIEVQNARIVVETVREEHPLGSGDAEYGIYAIGSERQTATVSFDVSYRPRLPLFGEGPVQTRRIEHVYVIGQKTEVS